MGFLKSVGHFFKHDIGRGANKFFKSGKIDGTKLIGKGSIASKGLSTVSKGLGQASGVLDSVGKVAVTILNNPITQGALGVIAPRGFGWRRCFTSRIKSRFRSIETRFFRIKTKKLYIRKYCESSR